MEIKQNYISDAVAIQEFLSMGDFISAQVTDEVYRKDVSPAILALLTVSSVRRIPSPEFLQHVPG